MDILQEADKVSSEYEFAEQLGNTTKCVYASKNHASTWARFTRRTNCLPSRRNRRRRAISRSFTGSFFLLHLPRFTFTLIK